MASIIIELKRQRRLREANILLSMENQCERTMSCKVPDKPLSSALLSRRRDRLGHVDESPRKKAKFDTEAAATVAPTITREAEGVNPEKHKKTLDDLPAELFCHVLSFVGPTSSSLLSLSETNKYFHSTMKVIGNAMLPRAKAHFRVPLRKLNPVESTTSLFLRHARTCSQVLSKLQHLRKLLAKNPSHMTSDEVESATAMTLELLEVGPVLSVALERQILSTCGKCGGKMFKYSKSMLFHALANPHNGSMVATMKGFTANQLQERQALYAKNQERLDLSRLIMQSVVFRELQLNRSQPVPASQVEVQQQPTLLLLRSDVARSVHPCGRVAFN